MWRFVGGQKFEFGVQRPHQNRKGEDLTWADAILEVRARWEVRGPEEFRVGSDQLSPERQDEHAFPFYRSLKSTPPVVQNVEVLEDGALRIGLTNGLLLSVDPDLSPDEEGMEWRFLVEGDPRGQLVLCHRGLEWNGW